jgi:hypothetical protein
MNRRREPFNNVSADSRPRAYLLGQLTSTDRDAFEAEMFADAALLEELQAAETELLDDDAASRLSEAEAQAWSAYVATQPRLRGRRSLAAALARPRKTGIAAWKWLVPVAAAMMLLLAYFAARRAAPEPVVAASFEVRPGVLRSNEAVQVLRIPPRATFVAIKFRDSGGAVSARLRLVDGGLETWQGPLNSRIPRNAFRNGDMIATLLDARGEEIADYSFRVEAVQ